MQDAFAGRDKVVMGRVYGVPGGDPLTGSVSGVRIVRGNQQMSGPIADRTGVYTLNGGRFRIVKGDPLPEGAVMEPTAEELAAAEAAAAQAAADAAAAEAAAAEAKKAEEAAAKKAAAEAKKPAETAQSSGPSETA